MAINTAPFEGQLLPTSGQLEVLAEYNERYWGNHFSQAELDAVAVDDAPQTFDSMRVIHADFGGMVETVEAWRKVFMSYRETHWNTLASPRDFADFIRLHQQTARYEPGLHVVRMDLTQDGDAHPTIADARTSAEQPPETLLAHAEGLALIGLHRAFREPGGFAYEHLPYLPGYETRNMFARWRRVRYGLALGHRTHGPRQRTRRLGNSYIPSGQAY